MPTYKNEFPMHTSNKVKPVQSLHGTPPATNSAQVTATPLQPVMDDKFIDQKTVLSLLGVSRGTLYNSPDMPVRYRLSTRCVRWRYSEVQAYIASRSAVAEQAQ